MLDLGEQPPANSFIDPDEVAREQSFPLHVYLCEDCLLLQLIHVVSAQQIFDRYLYLSSSSKALQAHYAQLAAALTQRYELRPGDLVVDVGCNDGILLLAFDPTVRRVGVEPSRVADVARSAGLEVVKAFLTEDTAEEIVHQHGEARVVTATNVFAHVDDIAGFTRAIANLIGRDGRFIIEVSYLPDMVDQALFDTIYHEHLMYWSLTSLRPFLRRCGLELVDAERIAFGASGPAVRVTAANAAAGLQPAAAVDQLLRDERAWGVGDPRTYETFADRVRAVAARLRSMLEAQRAQGYKVAAYGAPAKGNTLLNYLRADSSLIAYVTDANAMKQGKLTPGTHIRVVPERVLNEDMPPFALLLAWNYLDSILATSEYMRRGGRFIVPFPEPRVVP